jgi:23S rRNA (adenine2503-C2)-methyltransferase
MINIFDLSKQELVRWCSDMGEPPFRASQLTKWIHGKGVLDFERMSNISTKFKGLLLEHSRILIPEIIQHQKALDGTSKLLLKLESGEMIESVIIPEGERLTACISSQVGCAVDCSFCATGSNGFKKNLSLGEIISQIWIMNNLLAPAKITNVVMMGMGEPLLNYSNLKNALGLFLSDDGYGLSKRKVTVSTSGVVPFIYKLKEDCPVSLAVSLHSGNNDLRNKLVPINKKYPLEQLMEACWEYQKSAPKGFITMEITLLNGVNDEENHAIEIIKLIEKYKVSVKFNLIPYNPYSGGLFETPALKRIERYRRALQGAGQIVTIRKTRGDDVSGACGQLAGSFLSRIKQNDGPKDKIQRLGVL